MRGNLVDTVKDEVMLHDHHPERVTPVPSIVLDDSMGINLDPEIEDDERPAEHPSEDVHEDRVVGREMQIGPGEKRV